MKSILVLLKIFRYTTFLLFLLAIFLLLNINQHPISINASQYLIYTSDGFLLLTFVITVFIFTQISLLLKDFRYRIMLNIKKKEYNSKFLDSQKEMEDALKVGSKSSFVRLFKENINLKSYKLYKTIESSFSPRKRLRLGKILLSKNPDNTVAKLIYCEILYQSGKFTEAKKIISSVLDTSAVVADKELVYLMSKLAIDIELKVHGNLDFAQKYIDNIESLRPFIPKSIA